MVGFNQGEVYLVEMFRDVIFLSVLACVHLFYILFPQLIFSLVKFAFGFLSKFNFGYAWILLSYFSSGIEDILFYGHRLIMTNPGYRDCAFMRTTSVDIYVVHNSLESPFWCQNISLAKIMYLHLYNGVSNNSWDLIHGFIILSDKSRRDNVSFYCNTQIPG